MMKFLEGKKTYAVMACIIIFGALDAWNEYCLGGTCKVITIPTYVFSLLGMLGIYTRKVAK
jgi:hypothetical protein